MAKKHIGPEGRITKEGYKTTVEVQGATHLSTLAGVECLNPRVEEARRIYRKVFQKKPVYEDHEYDKAVQEHLHGKDTVVFGMNGYSSISEKNCQEWGIKP